MITVSEYTRISIDYVLYPHMHDWVYVQYVSMKFEYCGVFGCVDYTKTIYLIQIW